MDTIHKIVAWTLSPLGIFFWGLLVGGVLRARAWRRVGTLVMALAAVWLWVLSCSVTTRILGVPLEGEEIEVERGGDGEQADAIVLLGGGMGLHETCGRSEIEAAADRVWLAARLWKAGRAPVLTVSGSGAPAELAVLADMGVNTNGVLNLREAKNTEEEARLIKEAIAVHATNHQPPATRYRIFLVTSAWHMPRAKVLFERAGFEVMPAPTDYEMHYIAEFKLSLSDFFPQADSLWRNSAAFKEWVARACYWIKR